MTHLMSISEMIMLIKIRNEIEFKLSIILSMIDSSYAELRIIYGTTGRLEMEENSSSNWLTKNYSLSKT